jgi:hypothetical protein
LHPFLFFTSAFSSSLITLTLLTTPTFFPFPLFSFLLHNIMAKNHLSLFCIVEGEPQSKKFSVKPTQADTIDDLKDLIKTKKPPRFDDIAADELTLWRVSIPIVPANKDNTIVLNE